MLTCKKEIRRLNEIHLKYIDDVTIAEKISMKSQLDKVSVEARPQPDTFHERTGHVLDPHKSKVYSMFEKIQQYAEANKMKINYKKTKLIIFNTGKARDFFPRFNFNGEELEVIEETKLLGIMIRSDLSWSSHVNYIVTRANKKLWTLRRLKKLGCKTNDLIDVYYKQVRGILEQGVQIWHSGITNIQRNKIERVQKSALSIILGQNYKSYNRALKTLKLESLFLRREKLCKTFAKKCELSPKFSKWFKRQFKTITTRGKVNKYCEIDARTTRFEKSPISFLIKLLNNN